MSTTTTITEDRIELTCLPETSHHPSNKSSSSIPLPTSISHIQDEGPDNSAYSVTAVPDGGYGWIVVAGGFTTSFCNNAIINCWGVLQAALLNSTLKHVAPATLSYVGSLGLASGALYGLGAVSLMRLIGCRATIVLGNFLMGLSLIGASFCTTNLPGLFGTYSIVGGIGMSLNWTVNNTVPVQYFSARLGLANGLIKLGGGVGGCVMAVALEALNRRVGIEWTFRIQGLLTWAIGLPAAWVVKDRVPLRKAPFVDLSMFRSATFIATFVASAIGVFALFVPPYYLPLFAQSIGLSPSTGAGLVAAFNACNALGRFIAGPLCDKIGPLNMFVIAMALNAASMLAIWPVSSTLGPLVLFAIINGVANGAYFTTQPTVVAGIFGPGRAAVAMSMSVTGWSVGYLMGAPIAGYQLQAAGGRWGSGSGVGIAAYRPAIFYAGGTATISALCVLVARLIVTRKLRKRV